MQTALLHRFPFPLLLGMFFVQASNAIAQQCPFTQPSSYKGTTLLHHGEKTAYVFAAGHIKVDADGAPNAYHPDDTRLHCTKGKDFKGLDCPANAGYPTSAWWSSVLVVDPKNPAKAYIQKLPNEFSGYFVSKTSLEDPTKAAVEPTRYVDARTVPYLVFPRSFHRMKGTGDIGDVGYAINTENGKQSPFIVADIGPEDAKLGEMSIALGTALGGMNPNPRTGAGSPAGKILFVVFPKSASKPSWPRSREDIEAVSSQLITDVGGKEQLLTCTAQLDPNKRVSSN